MRFAERPFVTRSVGDLLRLVSDATGPFDDASIVVDIIGAAYGRTVDAWAYGVGDGGEYEIAIYWPDGTVEHFSSINEWPDRSLDGVVKLVPENWWWTAGLCNLSGHASIGPDYNGPAGDSLKAEFPPEEWDGCFNEDLQPGDGIFRVCQSLLICILTARLKMQERSA